MFQYDYKLKVCMVGSSGVGKSSLAQRIVTKNQVNIANIGQTIGLDFLTTYFLYNDKEVNYSNYDISKFDKDRSSKEQVLNYNKRTGKIYHRIETFPKPTIAMIEGYCIGGGLNLAVCCDIRICSEKSLFAMPAAKLSLGYPFSSIKRLFDTMGPGMSKHFMFTAERISSSEALNCGLVQKLVKGSELEDFVYNYAQKIAKNAFFPEFL